MSMNASQTKGMNIVFAGTPEFAAIHLKTLIENSPHTIVAVYTQPDKPTGRGKKLVPSPVKALAIKHGISLYQPSSLKTNEEQAALKALNADIMVVVAYGLLLPKAILDIPTYGCINVHGSILPRWRGAAPIQRAIEAGDTASGVTIMQMDVGLDTGDMLVTEECPIKPCDTTVDLHKSLSDIGPPALLAALSQMSAGASAPKQQDNEKSCYAKKLTKQEANIDWSMSAAELERKIRAFNPAPVCYTDFVSANNGNTVRLKIYLCDIIDTDKESTCEQKVGQVIACSKEHLHVQCGQGILGLRILQLPGKKPLDIKTFMNGSHGMFNQQTLFGCVNS